MQYRVLIMTDNTAMYEVKLSFNVFKSSNGKPNEFDPNGSVITAIFNNYGGAKPYNVVHLDWL